MYSIESNGRKKQRFVRVMMHPKYIIKYLCWKMV